MPRARTVLPIFGLTLIVSVLSLVAPADAMPPNPPGTPSGSPPPAAPPPKPTTGAPAAPKTTKPKPATTSSSADTTVPTRRPPDVEQGLKLYKQSCWQCHGETGLGDGPAAAALIGGVPPIGDLDKGLDALVRVISEGRGRMPAYSEDIDRHDARRILVYLREKRAGRAPAPGSDDEDAGSGEEGGG
jgi:mono/diheme cytochrome c family protein